MAHRSFYDSLANERNVLEQAIIKQMARLVGEYRGKPVDFDINVAETHKAPKVAIGF